MATDSLIFRCPACGIKLSVPLGLAGISGPCPSCWKRIQSPRAADPPYAAGAPSSGGAEPACVEWPRIADSPVPASSRPVARPLPLRTVPDEIIVPPETGIGSMWNALPTPLPRPSRNIILWLRFLLAALCVSGAAALAYFAAQ